MDSGASTPSTSKAFAIACLAEARLALVAAARHAMANALDVLGVEAPESM